MIVYHLSSIENTELQMPKYNGYRYGYGKFKNKKKYDRKRDKKVNLSEWR